VRRRGEKKKGKNQNEGGGETHDAEEENPGLSRREGKNPWIPIAKERPSQGKFYKPKKKPSH